MNNNFQIFMGLIVVVICIGIFFFFRARKRVNDAMERVYEQESAYKSKIWDCERSAAEIKRLVGSDRECTGRYIQQVISYHNQIIDGLREMKTLYANLSRAVNEANHAMSHEVLLTNLGGGAGTLNGLMTMHHQSKLSDAVYEINRTINNTSDYSKELKMVREYLNACGQKQIS